jgi:cytidine deaminase
MSNGSKRTIEVVVVEYDTMQDLPPADRELLTLAHEAASRAYAPYSKFNVGAALRMDDGTVVTGNNQENASYPAGICAERTALFFVMSQYPQGSVREMAVVVPSASNGRPVSPCGICRQVLLEQEVRQGGPMRLLLGGVNGPVWEVESARSLLPLSFDASFL